MTPGSRSQCSLLQECCPPASYPRTSDHNTCLGSCTGNLSSTPSPTDHSMRWRGEAGGKTWLPAESAEGTSPLPWASGEDRASLPQHLASCHAAAAKDRMGADEERTRIKSHTRCTPLPSYTHVWKPLSRDCSRSCVSDKELRHPRSCPGPHRVGGGAKFALSSEDAMLCHGV